MIRNASVRELSSVLPICQFFGFLIYISVRFIYISVTLLFTLFFSSSLCQNPCPCHFGCHLCHLWHLIDFKGIFLVMSVAKTCQHCRQNGKSLILKGFFIDKRVMSLIYRALSQIIIFIKRYYISHRCSISQRNSIKLFNTNKNTE